MTEPVCRARRPMGMPLLPFAIALPLLVASCANSASRATADPTMRLTLTFKESIEQRDPNIAYYVVFNTATTADVFDPANLTAAETSDRAGVLPSGSTLPAGPRAYGPWPADNPRAGFNLPFYLSGGDPVNPTADPRRTPSYTATVPLLPVTWTDYFVLRQVAGQLQVTQSQHPRPVSDPTIILSDVRALQRGQDWDVQSNSWILTIRIASLLNGASMVTAMQNNTAVPTGFVVPAAGQRFVTANFLTANGNGQIIDRWTLGDNDPGITLKAYPNAQDTQQQFRAAPLYPNNLPNGVAPNAVTFSQYNSQIRQ